MPYANIIAVMVTYNPEGDLRERVNAAVAEARQIIVVDNASGAAARIELQNLQSQMPDCIECIWNNTNMGLAAALNQGITRALEKNADWILLLDHDSQPERGMVATMLQTHDNWPAKNRIALIAPEIRDENSTTVARYLMPYGKFGFRRAVMNAPANDEALTVITSGSLIKASAFRELGLMPESFFIDCIDHDFCLRLKKHGWNILLVKNAILHHRLGNKTMHTLAGVTITTSNHSSARRFTIFRNRLWIWKRYGKKFPGFVLHDILASGYDVFRIAAFEKDKWPKLKAIAQGIVAGLRQSH